MPEYLPVAPVERTARHVIACARGGPKRGREREEGMEFELSDKTLELRESLLELMEEHVRLKLATTRHRAS